jgi:FixJ family two-component response regulator
MFEELPLSSHQTVIVIEGDEAVRDATCALLESVGIVTRSCASASALLNDVDAEGNSCIIVDVSPATQMKGLDFLNELQQRGIVIPAILTTSGIVNESLHAAAANLAATLLQKPYAPDVLMAHLRRVLDR